MSLITGSFRNTDPTRGVFAETSPYEKGFAAHYQKNIRPHIYSFERLRLESLAQASVRIKLSIPLLILAHFLIYVIVSHLQMLEGDKVIAFVTVSCAVFSGIFIWINDPIKKYTNSIKSNIFPNIISFIGDYKYLPLCPRRIHELEDSDIIPTYDRETSEDAISGKYKNVDIDLFETNLEQKRRGKNREYYVSVFKGIVITLSVHKDFSGNTIVKKDSGTIGNWIKSKNTHLDKVKLEDPKFEKTFEVYSSDQVEARYLLTTAFMERLLQLTESFGGKGIECSFYKNKLLIMIPIKRNLFEPGSIYQSEDFVDDAKSLLKEMNLIFQIINILKLDQNIGM